MKSKTYKRCKEEEKKHWNETLTFAHFAENPVCKYNFLNLKKKNKKRLVTSEQAMSTRTTHKSEV